MPLEWGTTGNVLQDGRRRGGHQWAVLQCLPLEHPQSPMVVRGPLVGGWAPIQLGPHHEKKGSLKERLTHIQSFGFFPDVR